MSKLRLSVSYSDSYEDITFSVLDADDKVITNRVFSVIALPADNLAHVCAYGLNKVLTDRTSDEKDKNVKLQSMDEVYELLLTGEWAKERVVGAPVVGAEVEALADIMQLSIPEAQAALAAYSKEQRKQILANEEVVKRAMKIRTRRSAATPASLDEFVS